MTLLECIKEMMCWKNADAIRLNDGARTWDLHNLYEAIANNVDSEVEEGADTLWSVQDDGIYRLDQDGYLINPAFFKATHIANSLDVEEEAVEVQEEDATPRP